jgi:hypothetical protein
MPWNPAEDEVSEMRGWRQWSFHFGRTLNVIVHDVPSTTVPFLHRARDGVLQVFLQDEKLAWWHKRSRAHHENWLQKFFGQPCNGELFVKQSINMEGVQPSICAPFFSLLGECPGTSGHKPRRLDTLDYSTILGIILQFHGFPGEYPTFLLRVIRSMAVQGV